MKMDQVVVQRLFWNQERWEDLRKGDRHKNAYKDIQAIMSVSIQLEGSVRIEETFLSCAVQTSHKTLQEKKITSKNAVKFLNSRKWIFKYPILSLK